MLVYFAPMLRKLTLAVMIGLAVPAAAAEPRSGIDTSAIDPAVRPQDDFWQFANGRWLAASSIPPDRAAWDTFSEVREKTQGQLRGAIEAMIDPNDKDHPERRKLADLYASFMDEASVEQAGLTSLREPLAKIRALRDKADLPVLLADLARLWVRIPFAVDVSPDEHDATTYVVHLRRDGSACRTATIS